MAQERHRKRIEAIAKRLGVNVTISKVKGTKSVIIFTLWFKGNNPDLRNKIVEELINANVPYESRNYIDYIDQSIVYG